MSDIEFIPGLIVKAPNDKAPEYVKAKLSIKRLELIAYLQSLEGDWVNADVKVSQGGKWYVQKDNWKPDAEAKSKPAERSAQRSAPAVNDPSDDIPF